MYLLSRQVGRDQGAERPNGTSPKMLPNYSGDIWRLISVCLGQRLLLCWHRTSRCFECLKCLQVVKLCPRQVLVPIDREVGPCEAEG